MELKELGRGVYACLQEDKGLGYSNSGLVNAGGGLVVDTFWDLPHTREMIRLYSRVWDRPAARVVNTHHNGDHCWGNQLFRGAEIIGHRECARRFGLESSLIPRLKHLPPDAPEALKRFAQALKDWDFAGIEVTPPTTLVDDQLALDLDGVEVRLYYVGPAHTAGDLIVHLPDHRVVFAGDVIFRLCTPIGWEGTYAKWCEALDRIAALAPKIIVPGHGPLCGVEGAREMKAYLQYVRAESKRFFDAGLSEMDAARRIDLGPYAGWTEPERLAFNVHRAYRELRGEPYDAAVDTNVIFRDAFQLREYWRERNPPRAS